jgi:hypothetical protein
VASEREVLQRGIECPNDPVDLRLPGVRNQGYAHGEQITGLRWWLCAVLATHMRSNGILMTFTGCARVCADGP